MGPARAPITPGLHRPAVQFIINRCGILTIARTRWRTLWKAARHTLKIKDLRELLLTDREQLCHVFQRELNLRLEEKSA